LVCDIKVGAETRQVVVLLDSGSSSTLIDQALASKPKAKTVRVPFVIWPIVVGQIVSAPTQILPICVSDLGRTSKQEWVHEKYYLLGTEENEGNKTRGFLLQADSTSIPGFSSTKQSIQNKQRPVL
jgi:hypothetical protein